MRYRVGTWFGASGAIALALMLSGLLSPARTPEAATLRNERVQVAYHLETGTFDVVDLSAGRSMLEAGCTEIGDWASTDTNRLRTARMTTVSDELGAGRQLTVECAAEGAPTLLSEFTLYGETNTFIVLRAGIKNTTLSPVRVRELHPLVDGRVFPGGGWSEVRTLNGDSGANQPQATRERFRRSANDLLLTLKQNGRRRSLVMGALKTADFTKWAQTAAEGGLDDRGAGLDHAMTGARVVSYLSCGSGKPALLSHGPRISVGRGQPYSFGGQPATARFATVAYDAKEVVLDIAGLNPAKHYAVGFSWWDYDANGRVESVIASSGGGQQVLLEKCPLPAFAGKQQPPEERAAELPPDCCRSGSCHLRFVNETNVPNAVVSEAWLWELAPAAALPGHWTLGHAVDLTRRANDEPGLPVTAGLEGSDPVGRLVEPGETYRSEDSFYADFFTSDPFETLEQYGLQLRLATHAKPNPYDFPTVCAWYAGVWRTRGAQDHPEKSAYKINTSAGLVEEAGKIRACGFLNYSRAAVRLVPDNYTLNNPQGWWDDEHWRSHGLYTRPYETSAKLGRGMHANGCLAFTYIQPYLYSGLISADFRTLHQDWLIGGELQAGLDYSMLAVQSYLKSRFAALRGSLDGFMVDYCDDLWNRGASAGRFAAPRMTATAFYRGFFASLREGIGAEARIHERNIQQPNNDLTLGLTDSQRTSWDTDKISSDIVSRSGLRWYKNRVVLGYDMDSKELNNGWKISGWSGSDQDGRRMMLTMAYVAASRLLLANSFRDLSPEALHDLSRTFPYPSEPRSARPLDAFITQGPPRVYDFAVSSKWHQLTLYNTTLPTKEEAFDISLNGEPVDGALGLDPAREYYVYDFWNHCFVGRFKGSGRLEQRLRPGEARMLAIHEAEPNPQFISANRHIMQGYMEMTRLPAWQARRGILAGSAKVVGGETYEVVLANNGYHPLQATARNATARLEAVPGGPGLVALKIDAAKNEIIEWKVTYEFNH